METDLLYTVQMQGASVCVLLLLVDLSSKQTYFVCLNDYIDKYLVPTKADFATQDTVTLYIPAINVLSDLPLRDTALSLYGKRAKLLSAFSLFAYQKNELNSQLGVKNWPVKTYRDQLQKDIPTLAEIVRLTNYFLNQIDTLDIWQFAGWPVLQLTAGEIERAKVHFSRELAVIAKDISTSLALIIELWHHLTNLNNLYEEVTRELHLPKFIGLLSGPNPPDIHRAEKK